MNVPKTQASWGFLALVVLVGLGGCAQATVGSASKPPRDPFLMPRDAGPVDVSVADHVLGTGTPGSITATDFVNAVAQGGKIRFNGGSTPFTLTLTQTARVFNNKPDVVIDGGGLVTLSGGGAVRIVYMNTSDSSLVWTTPHADNQEHPQLTVQNLTFADGLAPAASGSDWSGGGAIYAYGGRLHIWGCTFVRNHGPATGPDVGGGAVRAFAQYNGTPVTVVNSVFGTSATDGNVASNGGALSSTGTSWSIFHSSFRYNKAVGNGGNPADSGTPGGGSGGAIYNDGNTMTLTLVDTTIENNQVNAFGSAVFFVSNNHTGTVAIKDSTIRNNTGGGWNTLPGVSMFPDTVQTLSNVVWN